MTFVPLTKKAVVDQTITLIEQKKEDPNKFRNSFLYEIMLDAVRRFDHLVRAEPLPTDEAERETVTQKEFQAVFGSDAFWANGHMFSKLESVTLSGRHEHVILRGKLAVPALVNGKSVTADIKQEICFPTALIADIFNEVEWSNLAKAPDRSFGELPRQRDDYVKNMRALFHSEMAAKFHPAMAYSTAFSHEDTFMKYVEEGRVILTPRPDGAFVLSIEGLVEERANKEAAEKTFKIKRNFAAGYVTDMVSVKDWYKVKLKNILA